MNSQTIAAVSGSIQAQGSTDVATRAVGDAKPAKSVRERAAPKPERSVEVPTRDSRSLKYWVDGQSHQVVTTIIDDSDKSVIRQTPDEEVLRIAKAIDRMQGFLIDSKA